MISRTASRVPWNAAARQLELPSGLRHERALWIRENQVLEVRHGRGRVPFASQCPRPLELGLRSLRRRPLLFYNALPENDGLRLVLQREAELCRGEQEKRRSVGIPLGGFGHFRRGARGVAARERKKRLTDLWRTITAKSGDQA